MNKLKFFRVERGLTQKQVADKASVGARLYQDYEYNKREPGVRAAIQIAKALGTTVENLFGAATPSKSTASREGTTNKHK